MTETPLISVIIPTFNGARFLNDAIESVLAERLNYEIIVIDDGSTDDIEAVVNALPVQVRFIRQENKGPSSARNHGLHHASGELIAFIDVDDIWPAGRMNLLVSELQDNLQIDVVRGHAQILRRETPDSPFEPEGTPEESFPHYIGAALYRRSVFEMVGTFDEEMKFAEDADWFLRADAAGLNVKRIPKVTLHVRRHETNMTRDQSAVALNPLRLFKKHLERQRAAESERENPPSEQTP